MTTAAEDILRRGGGQTPTDPPPVIANPNPGSYDPNNPQPYQPPPTVTPPDITAPPSRVPDESTSAQSNVRPVFGTGGKGTLGSIAYIGDAILRGAMRGREKSQQLQLFKAKKLMDGYQYAKQTADNQILDIVQKPEVQEALKKRQSKAELTDDQRKLLTQYDQANAASDAAWQGLNQLQSKYLFGDGDKKGKKGKKGADTSDPLSMISSQDPTEKLKGIFLTRQRLGNPVQYQVRDLLSKLQQQQQDPQYQLNQLISQREQAIAKGDTEGAKTLESRIDTLRKEISPYRPDLVDKKLSSYPGADNKEHIIMQRPDGTQYETVSSSDVRQPAGMLAKPGTFAEFEAAVSKESGIDPKDLSSESILQLQRAFADSHKTGTIQQGHYIYKDDKTGQIVDVPITRRTEAPPVAVPKVSAATPAAGSAPGSTPPAATKTPAKSSGPAPPSASAASAAPPGSPPGTRVIGTIETADEKKIHAKLVDTSEKARTLTALLDDNEKYVNGIHSGSTKATPRKDLALIVAAVRAMNPGSVRLPTKEIELELAAGSAPDRAQRFYDKLVDGLLPDDQRDDLFSIVRDETTEYGKSLAKDWQTNMPNRPLPAHLKRYTSESASDTAGKKIATRQDILDYAHQHNMTEEQATQKAKDGGYEIKQ